MNILIIGGTRRCGPYLVQELVEDGHSVSFLHSGAHSVRFTDCAHEVVGDRRNPVDFASKTAKLKPDVIIDMIAMEETDVQSVAEIFRGRVERYVCISSFEVYAAFEAAWDGTSSNQPVPIPEDAPKRTRLHLYDDAPNYDKLLVEQAVMEAHARGDFSATILRWPALYGPRDTTSREWYYVKQALEKRPTFEVPEGGQALFSRGFIRNMAHSVVLAAENEDAGGEIYNAADTQSLSVRQIASLIAEIMGHTWEIISRPREVLPSLLKTSALPSSRVFYDIEPHLLLDLTKIRCELGYSDLVQVREAMESTVAWLVEHPPRSEIPSVHYKRASVGSALPSDRLVGD